jgi:hypothetical protein
MWRFFGNIASLAGIAGVSGTDLVGAQWKPWVALVAFISCMAYIAWRARKAFDTFSKQHYPRGYLPLSAFARYTTSDGCRITYELFRHIQIKKAYERVFRHHFFWSGSKDPVIRSDLQTVSSIRPIEGESMKEVVLTFPRIRMFNDVEVLHMRMELDDTDGKSSPYLAMNVEQPVRLLNFRVELLHANKTQHGKIATITRRPINKPAGKVEELGTVSFNTMTKSYSHQIADPEPGWNYRIEWVKPNGAKRNGVKS